MASTQFQAQCLCGEHLAGTIQPGELREIKCPCGNTLTIGWSGPYLPEHRNFFADSDSDAESRSDDHASD